MKKEVSPVVVIVTIVVVVAAIAFYFVRSTGAGKNAANIEKTIQSGLAGGPPGQNVGQPMTGPPPGVMPRSGGPPAPMIQMPSQPPVPGQPMPPPR